MLSKAELLSIDFIETMSYISDSKSFVYLDPPYVPISQTANFHQYTPWGFGEHEHLTLKEFCDELTYRNIPFVLSNSFTDFNINLYKEYIIEPIVAERNISPTADRHTVELLIYNF